MVGMNGTFGRRGFAAAVSAFVLGIGLTVAAPAAMAQDVLVLAAASTKNAVEKLAAQFKAKTGNSVTSSFAASSALAKQIENGAPADIFISADLDWMDYLQKRDLIKTDSRVNLLGNELVAVVPKGSTLKPDLSKGGKLADQLGDGRLATGDPSNVPVGKYAKAAYRRTPAGRTAAGGEHDPARHLFRVERRDLRLQQLRFELYGSHLCRSELFRHRIADGRQHEHARHEWRRALYAADPVTRTAAGL